MKCSQLNLFFLVKLLEESYEGPRHFDAHAYRSEDESGVWEFAAGCMRKFLILKEKARQFDEDAEVQALLQISIPHLQDLLNRSAFTVAPRLTKSKRSPSTAWNWPASSCLMSVSIS